MFCLESEGLLKVVNAFSPVARFPFARGTISRYNRCMSTIFGNLLLLGALDNSDNIHLLKSATTNS